MDIQSLYYFTEVAKDLHITRTANRLFMSQQTLSNHILRLEEYYGTPLLIRKPRLALTPAGEQVLTFADRLGKDEKNLKNLISDIEEQTKGVINFGASTFRMNACIPDIIGDFSREYPGVELRFTDNFTADLEPKVEDGTLDFAIIIGRAFQNDLKYTPLMDDQIMMCVDDTLLKKHYKDEKESLISAAIKGTDLRAFSKLPFCIQNNLLGNTIRDCFENVSVKPHIYAQCQYNSLSVALGISGVAACFTTQMDLASRKDHLPESLNVFPVLRSGKPIYQHIFLIQHSDAYLTKYAKRFQELLIEHFKNLADTEVI